MMSRILQQTFTLNRQAKLMPQDRLTTQSSVLECKRHLQLFVPSIDGFRMNRDRRIICFTAPLKATSCLSNAKVSEENQTLTGQFYISIPDSPSTIATTHFAPWHCIGNDTSPSPSTLFITKTSFVRCSHDEFVAFDIEATPSTLSNSRRNLSGSFEEIQLGGNRRTFVSFVRDHSLWIWDVESGEERMLMRAASGKLLGTAEYVMKEEFFRHVGYWLSEGGGNAIERVLLMEVDEREVDCIIIPPSAPNATPTSIRYPRVGSKNATVQPVMMEFGYGGDEGAVKRLLCRCGSSLYAREHDAIKCNFPWCEYIVRCGLSSTAGGGVEIVWLQLMNRAQTRLCIVATMVDAFSVESEDSDDSTLTMDTLRPHLIVLVDESRASWVEVSDCFQIYHAAFTDDKQICGQYLEIKFLFDSERTGHRHLFNGTARVHYSRSATSIPPSPSCPLPNSLHHRQITRGEWCVKGDNVLLLLASPEITSSRSGIFFHARRESPLEEHWMWVPFCNDTLDADVAQQAIQLTLSGHSHNVMAVPDLHHSAFYATAAHSPIVIHQFQNFLCPPTWDVCSIEWSDECTPRLLFLTRIWGGECCYPTLKFSSDTEENWSPWNGFDLMKSGSSSNNFHIDHLATFSASIETGSGSCFGLDCVGNPIPPGTTSIPSGTTSIHSQATKVLPGTTTSVPFSSASSECDAKGELSVSQSAFLFPTPEFFSFESEDGHPLYGLVFWPRRHTPLHSTLLLLYGVLRAFALTFDRHF